MNGYKVSIEIPNLEIFQRKTNGTWEIKHSLLHSSQMLLGNDTDSFILTSMPLCNGAITFWCPSFPI